MRPGKVCSLILWAAAFHTMYYEVNMIWRWSTPNLSYHFTIMPTETTENYKLLW